MKNTIHLVKLSVGTESVEPSLTGKNRAQPCIHRGLFTMSHACGPSARPKYSSGGSIYWVIKGSIQARQKLLGFEEVIGGDGIRRCAFILDPEIVRTSPALKRPFQGWRYLKPEDAPIDLTAGREADDALPPELAGALADIGIL